MKNKAIFFLFFALLGLYFLPYLVFGQDVTIVIHDNLDSEVPWRVVLAQSGHIFNRTGQDVVPQIMNGIPRAYMISGLNMIMLLYGVFPPFLAYAINHILVHVIAFLGMGLFLNEIVLQNTRTNRFTDWIAWGVALCFAILPFYTMYGLTIAGQPLLLYVFFRFLEGRQRPGDYLVMALFPFYSFLYLAGFLVLGEILVLLLFFWRKKPRPKALLAWGISAACSLIAEYDLLRAMLFDPTYLPHRSAWNLAALSNSFAQAVEETKILFLHGNLYANTFHENILALAGIAILLFLFQKDRRWREVLGLLGIVAFFSMIYGVYSWVGIVPLKQRFGVLSTLNIGRVYWLSPAIWYVIFALSLSGLAAIPRLHARLRMIPIVVLIFLQIWINFSANSEVIRFFPCRLRPSTVHVETISYRSFYGAELFSAIKSYIGLPPGDYRVVSLGLHPAIAQYNGFYTLDSYQNNYPLAYKQQFRAIIAPELAKSERLRTYFDNWGSRCYVYSKEIQDTMTTVDQNRTARHLALDMDAFKAMGGEYILSAAVIRNADELNLVFLKKFEDPGSAWRIYLYQAR